MSFIKVLEDRSELLNVEEVALLLAVTKATVLRWARTRQIPCIRIGDTIRFDPTTLRDWIDSQGTCVPGNTDDFQMKWTDLAGRCPDESRRPAAPAESVKTETK